MITCDHDRDSIRNDWQSQCNHGKLHTRESLVKGSNNIVFNVIVLVLLEFKWLSDFNSFEKSLLVTNVFQIIISLVVPLYMFSTNMSMFRYLMHDILEEFIGIKITMPTNLPKLPSMSHLLSAQKIKILLQKLQSKCEPVLNTSSGKTSNDVHAAIKMSTETILYQGPNHLLL